MAQISRRLRANSNLLYLLFITLFLPSAASAGVIVVNDHITTTTLWPAFSNVLIDIEAPFEINAPLTVGEGSTIGFASPDYFVLVNSTLAVNGTEASPVVFEPTNIGYQFSAGSSASRLEYAVIQNAGYASQAIRIQESSPTFINCTIAPAGPEGIGGAAFRIFNGSPRIEGCHISGVRGGAAYGIILVDANHPIITRNVIEDIVAGVGSSGFTGQRGLDGDDGGVIFINGEHGQAGVSSGGQGSDGPQAAGILIVFESTADVTHNIIRNVRGGTGGTGGTGGGGGHGGRGADGLAATVAGGPGGNGGDGGSGKSGGDGGRGGRALGIFVSSSLTTPTVPIRIYNNLITDIQGGTGGQGGAGGTGGRGGRGGDGGNGIGPLSNGGPGGDGGDGGDSGTSGDGGDGGFGYGIHTITTSGATPVDIRSNTIADIRSGDPGLGVETSGGIRGGGGLGGDPGLGGNTGFNGQQGIDGDDGPAGPPGAPSPSYGVEVHVMGGNGGKTNAGADIAPGAIAPDILLYNNILSFGDPDLGVAVSVVDSPEGSVDLRHNAIFGFNAPSSFAPLDPTNLLVDPLFENSGAGDFRLAIGSPLIDAGNNLLIPPGVTTDLDGEPRVTDGNADRVNVIDIGAYEAPKANRAAREWSLYE